MAHPKAPVSRMVQMRVLGTLLSEQTQSTDHWEYGVSNQWLTQLKESLNDLQSVGKVIPPIACSFNDNDNTFLGESVWKILVSWYGLSDHYELHRRPRFSKYVKIHGQMDTFVLADKDLDFIHISMCLIDHIDSSDKQLYQQVYFWEDVNFLHVHLHRALGIAFDRNLRLWALIKVGDEEVFLGTLNLCEETESFGMFLCSKLPKLLGELTRRQELPLPTAPPESLSSFSSCKTHLSEVLQRMDISVTLCVEDIGLLDSSLQTLPVLPGLSKHLLVTQGQGQWTHRLHNILDSFETELQFSVKNKRDELSSEVLKLVNDKFAAAEALKSETEAARKEMAMREKRFKERERDLDEREHDLNTKVDKFKRGLTDYLMQRKKLEEELKRIEDQNKFVESRVELNVGGTKFTTSTITLTREPESLLGLMFSGRHHIQREADGSFFIDRDGTNFRFILNYLRDGSRAADNMPASSSMLQELQVEAEYYQLSALSTLIRDKLSHPSTAAYSSLPPGH